MEEARVEIRNIRRDAADELKKEERDGDVGDRRGASPARDAPEDDRPATSPRSTDSAAARSRRSSRSSGPRAARPADRRPPLAHVADAGDATPAPAAEPSPTPARRAARRDLPRHVAIIMDGNRRWARPHDLPELEGHAAGVEAIREPPAPRGPARRPGADAVRVQPRELGPLRRRGHAACSGCSRRRSAARPTELRAQGVRIRLLGRLDELPDDTRALDRRGARRRPPAATGLLLNIAFNYAGRTELVDAVRRLAASGIAPGAIDEATICGGALHGRPAGPGPRHPDGRRAAPVQLPDLAVGLRRVLLGGGPLAGLRRRTPSTPRCSSSPAGTRRFGR